MLGIKQGGLWYDSTWDWTPVSRTIAELSTWSMVWETGIQLQVIPKTQKIVLDAALIDGQHYKVQIKGKVEQSREWSSVLSYTSV